MRKYSKARKPTLQKGTPCATFLFFHARGETGDGRETPTTRRQYNETAATTTPQTETAAAVQQDYNNHDVKWQLR